MAPSNQDQGSIPRALENQLRDQIADLAAANRQLESVVYSSAQELSSTSRSMQRFAQILLDDYSPDWDKVPQTYLKRIVRSAETIDAITVGLLNYGTPSRSELKLEPVALQKVWQAALEQHEACIRQQRAQIETAAALPSVLANEPVLTLVLANLLGNSLKFTRQGIPPRIRFWTEEKESCIRLWLSDEGIGIAPEDHERIFRIFHRLNGTLYEGAGIGLSLVQNGVQQMQGRVGLESHLTGETRFWLELAKVEGSIL